MDSENMTNPGQHKITEFVYLVCTDLKCRDVNQHSHAFSRAADVDSAEFMLDQTGTPQQQLATVENHGHRCVVCSASVWMHLWSEPRVLVLLCWEKVAEVTLS